MLGTKLHQAAAALLQFETRIAPPYMRDWGQGMMNELNHVEGPWAVAMWTLGSSSVLAKHALLALLLPNGSKQAITSRAGLFADEFSMAKATLITAGACVLAALLMFTAPAFRQAFQLSLAPWHWVFKLSPRDDQPGLRDLARRAEGRHDAEGLAFCAERTQDDGESVRLAEEAVRLDPNLLWIYAAVALHHPRLAVVGQWVPKLEKWNPQNALFYMITAENTAFLEEGKGVPQELARNPARLNAMAAAFQSTEFDDYLDRLEALECKVLPRYGLSHPDQVASEDNLGVPFVDSRDYAKSIIQSGKELEAKGDKARAIEKYWSVARYGQLIDFQGHTRWEHINGATLQRYAYQQLQAVAEREGNHTQAAHFAYLSFVLDPRRLQSSVWTVEDIAQWNAWEVTVSGLLMLFFAGCLGVAASVLIVRRKGAGPKDLRAKRIAAKFVLAGAVGLFLSSAMLYVTYHPYATILGRLVKGNKPAGYADILDHVLKGDKSGPYAETLNHVLTVNGRGVDGLRIFLAFTREAPLAPSGGTGNPYRRSRTLYAVYYFWLAVTLLGLIGIILMTIRHLRSSLRVRLPA